MVTVVTVTVGLSLVALVTICAGCGTRRHHFAADEWPAASGATATDAPLVRVVLFAGPARPSGRDGPV